MGALADGALEAGGRVIGVLPEFMQELEWGHSSLSELKIVASLHERKMVMIEKADGIIALPGGSGTFEELLEALTWKRLALFTNPIVLLNIRNYYDAFQQMMQQAVDERFMHQQHLEMGSLVDKPLDLVPALRNAPNWDPKKVGLAVQKLFESRFSNLADIQAVRPMARCTFSYCRAMGMKCFEDPPKISEFPFQGRSTFLNLI